MNVSCVYFSPTGTTKRVIALLSGELSPTAADYNITVDNPSLSFGEHDLVLIGIPVYSGRVPRLARPKIAAMRGHSTLAILVVTYGNRHYDDALLELKDIVQPNGFRVLGAIASVAEHSVVPKFGRGRPDDADLKALLSFAAQIKRKMASGAAAYMDLPLKGNPAYRAYKSIPMKPHAAASCVKCGVCAKNCPAGAIPAGRPNKTDKKKCVTCVRCVRMCPQKARGFFAIEKRMAEKSLEKRCREYKHPEIFV